MDKIKHNDSVLTPVSTTKEEKTFFSAPTAVPFFNSGVVQPQLSLSRSGDPYEQEADAMADQVMQAAPGPDGKIQRKEISSLNGVAKQGSGDYQAVSPPFENNLNNSKGEGSPLPADIQTEMTSAFGADFHEVRIHTGARAAQMNDKIRANAFTHGADIYFNSGKYNPASAPGKHLLAHELTHVVQQQRAGAAVQRYNMDNAPYGDPDKDMRLKQYKEVKRVCEPGEPDDSSVQKAIDEALAFARGTDGKVNLDMAWSHLFQERRTHCCDYNLAAAEHYMWARKEVANGFPAALMKLQIWVYDVFKRIGGSVAQKDECPPTQTSAAQRDWAFKGVEDGEADHQSGNQR